MSVELPGGVRGDAEMPSVDEYFSFLAKELQQRSDLIAEWFSTHRLSAGANREDLLKKLLSDFLPSRFHISTGLAMSAEGEFSNQADILVVDDQSGRPFFGESSTPVWLIESVFALIEVKTHLNPEEIKDALSKCQRFKRLKRLFAERPEQGQRISDSLFILWGFNAPTVETFTNNISEALSELEDDELPDFVICPNKFLLSSGAYLRLSKYGQDNSELRKALVASGQPVLERFYTLSVSEEHCMLMLIIWLTSWLSKAGPRAPDVARYMVQGGKSFGIQSSGVFLKKAQNQKPDDAR